LNFLNRFSKNTKISIFKKIHPVGAEMFHADRQIIFGDREQSHSGNPTYGTTSHIQGEKKKKENRKKEKNCGRQGNLLPKGKLLSGTRRSIRFVQ